MPKIEIRPVQESEWEIVWNIIKQTADWLQKQGMNHWSAYYTAKVIKEKFKNADVFVLFENNKPVGTGSKVTMHLITILN